MEILEKIKYELEMSGLKEATRDSYLKNLKVYLKSNEKDYQDISLEDVRNFLRYLRYEKNYAIGTVNNYRSSLKYFYNAILEKHWIDEKVPRFAGYNPLPSVLSKDEVQSFIESFNNRMYRSVLYTMYSSGLRIGEVATIRIKDVDSKRMQIYIPNGKNGSARYVILANKNLQLLRKYIIEWKRKYNFSFEPEDYLFPSPINKKSHIAVKTLKNRVSEHAKRYKTNKKITSHTLRHSFGTHLLESEVDIFTIKELMGHKSIQSTDIYLHLASISNLNVKSPFDEGGF